MKDNMKTCQHTLSEDVIYKEVVVIGQSLYETDLIELAEGLEGRSQNPIPLLIDHIVLGRGPPGGSWHTFPRTVRTLSPAAWLALPPHTSASVGDARLSARAVAQYCRRYSSGRGFRYLCSRVVVACGGGDRPNTLPSPHAAHAHHTLAGLERAVQELVSNGTVHTP
ncbi:Uncharacterized protein OBRU01_18418 [Operophtera brumata]|uniref:Uncharacterized protein n=1 Tax=Operophtera brumata TaxID=104452 RepID=A0A0L7KYP2_OPEBR|nr:Uncharacterized protein OBRU01_18418 [Operophtera brumata]